MSNMNWPNSLFDLDIIRLPVLAKQLVVVTLKPLHPTTVAGHSAG